MIKSTATVLVLAAVTCLVASAPPALAQSPPLPASFTGKVAETPNFYQLDPRLPAGGEGMCAPTAASDCLVYLGYHGYPGLLPQGDQDPTQAQIDIIRTISSQGYMGTTGSTGPSGVLLGVWKYVREHGFTCPSQYMGYVPIANSLSKCWAGAHPDLNLIKAAVDNPNCIVLLAVGAFTQEAPGQWVRISGHMVAVVGYGTRGDGVLDPNALILKNPGKRPIDAPIQTDDIADNYVTLVPMSGGQLTGKTHGLPCDATGYYEAVGPGLPKRPNSPYISVVEGMFIFTVGGTPPSTATSKQTKTAQQTGG